MGYITTTEYALEEPVGDNTITIIDRLDSMGKLKTFIYIADEDDGEILLDAKDMNAIALRLVALEIEMKRDSPLRKKGC